MLGDPLVASKSAFGQLYAGGVISLIIYGHSKMVSLLTSLVPHYTLIIPENDSVTKKVLCFLQFVLFQLCFVQSC